MIRPATSADVEELARTMREADVKEVRSLSGMDPLTSLSLGFFHSDPCWAGIGKGGKLACLFGVVAHPNDLSTGSIWLLSSPAIAENRKELIRDGRKWISRQLEKYEKLTNVVSVENTVHVNLIKHLGFTFTETIHGYGTEGVTVRSFERNR